jgi:hypothetical protein
MANHTPMSDRLRLTDLIQRREFQRLTSKQQAFVSKYIANGVSSGTYDAVASVMAAYGISAKTARVFSYELLGNPRINAVLDMHFGRTEYDSIMEELGRCAYTSMRRDMKNGGTLSIATVKAIQIYKSHMRQTPDAIEVEFTPAPELPFSKVGGTVTMNGKLFTVTAVDKLGHPTDVEPLEQQ